jgi:hypothetical protein
MNIEEFFFLSVSIGIWLTLIILTYVSYRFIKTLKSIENTLKSYEEVKNDLSMAGDTVKLGALTLFSKILSSLTKRG